ncbi:SRPBCC family protein [Pseudoalteromonas sp. MMG005]|uniref:SRPBCC family protein n=1 Tax=Pseudoalteromonas sp. MMG005 TaxID=2822682 RepID=UPI001B3A35DF|nr:SRPBCC family protein [Pseudoalteromonas sp. MMG005]MBQ4848106.1 SRPBCC family protein [Pseudoalteromonas sp. MMG005]
MTHHTEKSLKVNIPAHKVWQVLADFSGIEKFATTIKSSSIVGNKTSGLGAKRKCTFDNNSSLVEEVIDYQEGQGYRMVISDHSLPLESMYAEMKVKAIDENTSEIYMSADFVVKGGVFGKLVGHMLMRPMMKGVFTKVMSGLAYYTVTGERVDKTLPKKEVFSNIIIS